MEASRKIGIGLFLTLFILFQLIFLNHQLFDWDEINFAESAREMIITQNYSQVQVNFAPFWQKPPLFLWMQSLSMHIFGINEFAARFPNAFFGLLTILTLFFIGRRQQDSTFGYLLALLYGICLFPFAYFKTGIIDPVFNYFILLSIYQLYLCSISDQNTQRKHAIWGGIWIGLAILTKGPVAFLLALLTFLAVWMVKRFKKIILLKYAFLYGFTAFLVSTAWFAVETVRNGPWFLKEFIYYQYILLTTPDAGHEQPWFYHFLVVFIGCFPASTLWIGHKLKIYQKPDGFLVWMQVLASVVLILFTLVTTKIIHYSSLAWFPVVYLAANTIYKFWKHQTAIPLFSKWLTFCVGLVFGLIFLALPYLGMNTALIAKFTKDQNVLFAVDVPVNWQLIDYLPGTIWIITLFAFLVLSKNTTKALYVSGVGFMLAICLIFGLLIPKIAEYTQGPVIRFLQTHQGKNVYVEVLGRSYAHFFYLKKTGLSAFEQQAGLQPDTKVWDYELARREVLFGAADRPVYLIAKAELWHVLEDYPHFELLYQEGAFRFLKRKKTINNP